MHERVLIKFIDVFFSLLVNILENFQNIEDVIIAYRKFRLIINCSIKRQEFDEMGFQDIFKILEKAYKVQIQYTSVDYPLHTCILIMVIQLLHPKMKIISINGNSITIKDEQIPINHILNNFLIKISGEHHQCIYNIVNTSDGTVIIISDIVYNLKDIINIDLLKNILGYLTHTAGNDMNVVANHKNFNIDFIIKLFKLKKFLFLKIARPYNNPKNYLDRNIREYLKYMNITIRMKDSNISTSLLTTIILTGIQQIPNISHINIKNNNIILMASGEIITNYEMFQLPKGTHFYSDMGLFIHKNKFEFSPLSCMYFYHQDYKIQTSKESQRIIISIL